MFKIPENIVELYTGKTILIVGAVGYIGSSLAKTFADIDCNLILLDCEPDTGWLPVSNRAKISFINNDICEQQTWLDVITGTDYIFHLAAAEYNRTTYDPAVNWRINACAVLYLLNACRKVSLPPKIIFSSSANLFGCADSLPVNESTPDNPPSLWSVHKQLAENYFDLYRQNYGIETVILRLSNVYGPSGRIKSAKNVIINRIINQALMDQSIALYPNKNCVRDYIFIDDVILAFIQSGVIKNNVSNNNKYYIIGSEESKTIAQAWQIIAEQIKIRTNIDVFIKYDRNIKLEPLDFRNFVADTTCFNKAVGWKATTSFVRGVNITLEIFYKNIYQDTIK